MVYIYIYSLFPFYFCSVLFSSFQLEALNRKVIAQSTTLNSSSDTKRQFNIEKKKTNIKSQVSIKQIYSNVPQQLRDKIKSFMMRRLQNLIVTIVSREQFNVLLGQRYGANYY